MLLVNIARIYSWFHSMIAFLFIYEYRGTKKRFIIAYILFMCYYMGVTGALLFYYGDGTLGGLTFFICTMPSLAFYYIFAKTRGASFLFFFCMTDTVTAWILFASTLADTLLKGDNAVALAVQLVAFPVYEFILWKWCRRPVLRLQRAVRRGWGFFAAVTGLFYICILVVGTRFDTMDGALVAALILLLMPVTYVAMLWTLYQLMLFYQNQERQSVLQTQAAMMELRAEEIRRAEEKLRIERHDLRHRLDAVAAMVEREERSEALGYIGAARASLDETAARSYCANAVLDAILSVYFQRAEKERITVETRLAIPDELPVDAAELSTVFANALENAIQACARLPEAERRILCTCICEPKLMLEISNPCTGEVEFGPDGLPAAQREGHGMGVRSIMAFAEKHDAACRFTCEDGWFRMQMAL